MNNFVVIYLLIQVDGANFVMFCWKFTNGWDNLLVWFFVDMSHGQFWQRTNFVIRKIYIYFLKSLQLDEMATAATLPYIYIYINIMMWVWCVKASHMPNNSLTAFCHVAHMNGEIKLNNSICKIHIYIY